MKKILALCALSVCIPASAQQIYRVVGADHSTVSGTAPAAATRPEIKMYVDIEKSDAARAEYQGLGGRGVPVILVGTQRMNGFSEERLAQMLKAAGY